MSNIKINDNGPYIITGSFELKDSEGNTFDTKKAIALCRCGHSDNKPFCDGAHNKTGFDCTTRA